MSGREILYRGCPVLVARFEGKAEPSESWKAGVAISANGDRTEIVIHGGWFWSTPQNGPVSAARWPDDSGTCLGWFWKPFEEIPL